MKILVTGVNGLLGQKLTFLLSQDQGVDLIATARKSPKTQGSYPFAPLDITNQRQVEDVLKTHHPDVVINTAAMTQVDQCETEREICWANNVTAVKYLADACGSLDIRLIHLSTDFIFDGTYGPLDETAVPHPLSYYGESKLASERIVQASQARCAILRTVLVYGVTPDMSRSNIVLWVKQSLESGKTINVINDQWRTPTLAEDLAAGCRLAALQSATGIYHVSGEEMMTPFDIAMRTARFFNLDQSLIHETDSTNFKQPAVRPRKTGFVIDKARKALGYHPHSFEEGLAILARQFPS